MEITGGMILKIGQRRQYLLEDARLKKVYLKGRLFSGRELEICAITG